MLTGSGHTAESLWAALADLPDLREKTRLGPPGVDVEEFRPRGGRVTPLVAFVGKLIVSKGVDLLLAAWPLVRAANPQVRLEVAGYGAYEETLRRLLRALECGDLKAAREIAAAAGAWKAGRSDRCRSSRAFLADPPEGYPEMARAAAGSVEFIGRLEHHEVASFFPRAEAMVMPSTFPEAFGMVAVEAAACGTLPVSAGHSGMLEVSRQLARPCPAPSTELVSFPVEEGAVEAIAERLNAWFALREISERPRERPWWRPSAGSGAGREWRAGCLPPPPGNSTVYRAPRPSGNRHLGSAKPPAAASIECPPPQCTAACP